MGLTVLTARTGHSDTTRGETMEFLRPPERPNEYTIVMNRDEAMSLIEDLAHAAAYNTCGKGCPHRTIIDDSLTATVISFCVTPE
jgi:hypothetical protein